MKLHVSLAARDLDASVAFYSALLGTEPAKQFDDYALFITEDPGLELALDLNEEAKAAPNQHFGVAVDSLDIVDLQIQRLRAAGYAIDIQRDETCCYANQTKVWASDPEGRRWETYFVNEETERRAQDDLSCCRDDASAEAGAACCA